MKLQPKFVRRGDRVLHVLVPLIGAVADGAGRQVDARVEHLHARDPDTLHVGKVGFDTVLGHIAVDPMPPHERARGRRWCGESGIEPIGGRRLVRETSREERNDQGGAHGLHPSENVVRAMVMDRRQPLDEGVEEHGLR